MSGAVLTAVRGQMFPFVWKIDDQRDMQAGFVQVAFPAGQTAAVIAEYEDDGIVFQPVFFQVIEEEAYPSVHILDCFQMSGIVRAHFREIRHMWRKIQKLGIDTLQGIVPSAVRMECADPPHV